MSKIDRAVVWGPDVLGGSPLDERRWAFCVKAPFDMPADIPDLIGMKVHLNGREFEIGGIVAPAPACDIKQGDLIELLVRA